MLARVRNIVCMTIEWLIYNCADSRWSLKALAGCNRSGNWKDKVGNRWRGLPYFVALKSESQFVLLLTSHQKRQVACPRIVDQDMRLGRKWMKVRRLTAAQWKGERRRSAILDEKCSHRRQHGSDSRRHGHGRGDGRCASSPTGQTLTDDLHNLRQDRQAGPRFRDQGHGRSDGNDRHVKIIPGSWIIRRNDRNNRHQRRLQPAEFEFS